MFERALTSLRLRALDARERLSGRRDPLVPPRRIQVVGRGDFVEAGEDLAGRLRGLADLAPEDRVLDVSCGTGSLARAMAGFLDPQRGSYDGFDVDARGIGWCRRRYRRGHPNFGFRVADLYNRRRHPGGAFLASEYRFPYEDGSFDLVVVDSVFTELLEDEADHFLAESARVLVEGGRLFATFFLLDETSRARIAAGQAGLPFLDATGHVAVVSDELPEEAVAYATAWVGERLTSHELEPATIRPGTWSGRDDGEAFQDVVVARRPNSEVAHA